MMSRVRRGDRSKLPIVGVKSQRTIEALGCYCPERAVASPVFTVLVPTSLVSDTDGK